MEKCTVKQVSEMLNIPKDTLIYYDKLEIVQPQRGDNGYRYYTSQNIDELKFVEVAKSTDFSLKEIKRYLEFQRQPSIKGFQWQREDMRQKRVQLSNKIKDIQAMIDLLDVVDDLMEQKVQSNYEGKDTFPMLLEETFARLRRDDHEE